MSWIDKIFGTVDKSLDLASEAIEDKDLSNQLRASIEELKQSVYIRELETKTVPWVDALHKMQRGILSMAGIIASVYFAHQGVTDALALAAPFAPAGAYNFVKGKGRP